MSRRIILLAVALALAVPTAFVAEGQDAQRVRRVGFIGAGGPSVDRNFYDAVQQALREAGWIDGETWPGTREESAASMSESARSSLSLNV